MDQMTWTVWAVAVFCAVILGMTKAGFAGLSMVSTPIMVSLFQAKTSVGILLPMLIIGDVFAVFYYHRHANWRMLSRLVPTAFTGIVLGSLIMHRITNTQLRVGIGVIVLLMVGLTILRNRGIIPDERIPKGWRVALITGLVAGITTMLAHAAGPVMQVYFLAMGLKKNEFIGTGAWFFCLINLFKVPFYVGLGLITPETLLIDAKIMVGIPVGIVIGILLVKRLSDRGYAIWVQTLAAIGGLKLVLG